MSRTWDIEMRMGIFLGEPVKMVPYTNRRIKKAAQGLSASADKILKPVNMTNIMPRRNRKMLS